MASLSNINGLFDVHSTGAILFSTSHGTSGQILRSNGNAAPTWVAASTVIGGPYLPLTGGTLTGATATASGISFTVGGKILVGTGATAAASLNAFTQTVSANLYSALRVIENSGASSYWDIGAIGGGNTLLNFYHNGTTTPKISFTNLGGATFAETITTPQVNLHGVGTTYLNIGNATTGTASSDGASIGFYTGQTSLQIINRENDAIVLSTNNSPSVTILGNGNVGIGTGTASPASVLHVKDNSAGPTQISLQSNDFTRAEEINFLNPSTSAVSGQIKYYTNPTVEYMSFSTSNNSATVERMRIANNGWVSVVTKPNSGLNYDVAIWVGNVLGYQTTSQLSDVLAYQPNKLSPYNGITFADGQEATNSGGTVIPAPGRNTSPDPEDYQRSFSTEFKLKSASGNPGVTGSWAGLISMAPYRPATSSFYATQIAFGGDGTGDGMFTRRGTQTTWGAWREFIIKDTSGNISPSGVYLGGTIAANRLDYYKTDTWAPQIYYQNATDQANATNSTQTGIYTKIGNVCTVQFRLIWTQASGTPAVDNIGIKNLPFGGNTTQAYAEVPCSLIGYTGGPSPRGNLTLTLPGANQTLAIFNDTNNSWKYG